MAIGRLSIPDGTPIPGPEDATGVDAVISRLFIERFAEIELLATGDYDVTPEIWTKHTHIHEVTVFDNGQGRYRMTPRDADVGYQEFWRDVSSKIHLGGRQVGINDRYPLSIIGGGHPNKPTLQIFGLVVYLP
jgi:hypothetical protein